MRGKASLWLAVAGFCLVQPEIEVRCEPETLPVISLEDLQDALERGDLTPSEFGLLAELVGHREQADSIEAVRLARLVSLAQVEGRRTSGPPGGRVEYSIYAPLRGSGRYGEELRALPGFGGASATIHARREQAEPWVVTEASVKLRRGAALLQAGSLHPVWAGGLVLGRSPVFAGDASPGLAGLWRPSRARLRGALARVALPWLEAEALGSSVSGAAWRHGAVGARIRAISKSVWIEPALLSQSLQRVSVNLRASFLVWGLSAGVNARQAAIQAQSVMASGAPAFQAQASGRKSVTRWQVEYWRVSPDFRNPLSKAKGELDSERIYYPELDTSLSSASTGESGGRVALRSGPSRFFGEVGATAWREQPARTAAIRLEAAAQASGPRRLLRLEFLHLAKPGTGESNLRNELALKARRGSVFAELRGKWTHPGELSPPVTGGRVAAAIQANTMRLGLWEAGVAWDAYDLSLASGQFVTLRVHHSLPLGHGELAWNLRWRSAYASYPAALSLRLNSSVYL